MKTFFRAAHRAFLHTHWPDVQELNGYGWIRRIQTHIGCISDAGSRWRCCTPYSSATLDPWLLQIKPVKIHQNVIFIGEFLFFFVSVLMWSMSFCFEKWQTNNGYNDYYNCGADSGFHVCCFVRVYFLPLNFMRTNLSLRVRTFLWSEDTSSKCRLGFSVEALVEVGLRVGVRHVAAMVEVRFSG